MWRSWVVVVGVAASSCSIGWTEIGRSLSPDGGRMIVLYHKTVFLEGRMRAVLHAGERQKSVDVVGQWGLRRFDAVWVEDSSVVALLLCQGITPRYGGFDVETGEGVEPERAGFLLARAYGVAPDGLGEIATQFCRAVRGDVESVPPSKRSGALGEGSRALQGAGGLGLRARW